MDELTPELAKLFAGKEQRRQKLARISYPEKVRAVIQLQQMTAAILRSRGKSLQPWALDTPGKRDGQR